jgi:glycosyltransferase involved in cell wall biosynthesis
VEVTGVDLTLVTVTQPKRRVLLPEMQASVAAQTVLPAAHVVVWDLGAGFEATVNRAVGMVETDFYCLVDDDDLLLPDHVETLSANLTADVVWSWVEVRGRDWNPNSGYVPGLLQNRNYIPSNHAFRTSLFRELDGYRKVAGWADHDLLKRAESAGATFLNVPKVTWVYRFHGENMSA